MISTPGRLMDHLNITNSQETELAEPWGQERNEGGGREGGGLNVSHLRYLVIDEADRLLQQSYQDWLPHVLHSAHLPSSPHLPSPNLSSPYWTEEG